MTAINLLDSLRDFIKVQVQNYIYHFTRLDGSTDVKTPVVYSGYLPVRIDADTEYSPFIIVKLVKINDEQDQSTADVRIVFTIHDEDSVDNWRSQLNIMEHVRQAMLKQRTVANKFSLILPVSYEAAEYSQLPYPEGYGFLNATYQIGQIQEEDPIYGYFAKE